MKRIEINFKPTAAQVLTAIDYANANLDRIHQEAFAGNEHALRLFGARKDYLAGRDSDGVWINHFYTVYAADVASREVRS